jgi:hypothetical protein
MATIVGFNNLSKAIREGILSTISGELSSVAVNRKLEQLEPPKSSIEIVPAYVSAATAAITQQLAAESGATEPGFTGQNSIEFYINVLNAIDNMILLDFIRDNQAISTTNNINYSVTKTTDINIDMALVYYSIKYPTDTTVDSGKLDLLKKELDKIKLV